MNILILTQFLSTTKGGGEYLFSLIANGLAKKGHKIHIITHKIENENYTYFHPNVKIYFISAIKYEGGLPPSIKDNIRFISEAIPIGLKIIRNEKIELIHSNNFSPSIVGSILSTLTSKPHITTIHDIFSLCGKNYWKMWGKQSNISRFNIFLAPLFEKLSVKLKHDAIHTVSDATKDDLVKFGAKKPIHVILNSINITEQKIVESSPFQFVYVGRLVFYKNVETVIRAVSIIKKSNEKIKLKIIGGGPHKQSLVELTKQLGLQDNIEFCGYVSEDEKYRIISSSNAMVFPSLCEGFGLVILESYLCRRPVLVSNVRPLSDIVDNMKNGLVIEATNERKWADAMIYIIENIVDSKRMGEEGRKKLESQYNSDIMLSHLESTYTKVTSKK